MVGLVHSLHSLNDAASRGVALVALVALLRSCLGLTLHWNVALVLHSVSVQSVCRIVNQIQVST